MKLLYELPEEYIDYCRQAVVDQQTFLQGVKDVYGAHRFECDGRCPRCERFQETIALQEQLLDQTNEVYEKALRGIYG